jgi:hypothetical protein
LSAKEKRKDNGFSVFCRKSLRESIVFSKKYAILFAEKGEQTSGFAGHDVLPGTETAEK